MNWKALDDPALLMPRVMDVDGTLRGLGFERRTGKSWQHYRTLCFYRLNVQLFYPVESKLTRRAISHVGMILYACENQPETYHSEYYRLELYVSYGYPIRRVRGMKVVDDFKALVEGPEQFEYVINNDHDLRYAERTIREAIVNIRTKKLNCTVTDDDLNEREITGWEALQTAVRVDLHKKDNIVKRPIHLRTEDGWWFEKEPEPIPEPEHVLKPGARLPNFDRLPFPRHRQQRGRRAC